MPKLIEFLFTFVGIVPLSVIQLTKHQQKGRFVLLDRQQSDRAFEFINEKTKY